MVHQSQAGTPPAKPKTWCGGVPPKLATTGGLDQSDSAKPKGPLWPNAPPPPPTPPSMNLDCATLSHGPAINEPDSHPSASVSSPDGRACLVDVSRMVVSIGVCCICSCPGASCRGIAARTGYHIRSHRWHPLGAHILYVIEFWHPLSCRNGTCNPLFIVLLTDQVLGLSRSRWHVPVQVAATVLTSTRLPLQTFYSVRL